MARASFRGITLRQDTWEKLQRFNEQRFAGRLSISALIDYLADEALAGHIDGS